MQTSTLQEVAAATNTATYNQLPAKIYGFWKLPVIQPTKNSTVVC
jgi:hypothetical protein